MKKLLLELKGHLMTGIGYMLPLIIGSSLVVAIPQLIGLAMGITSLTEDLTGVGNFLYQVQQVGWTGIGMVNTVLAGFIAYSIADKPALAAGLIAGKVATDTYAGFLGACIYAFIAGYFVKWCLENIHVPESAQSIMPVVILPLIGCLTVAIVGTILAGPLGTANTAIVEWLKAMCREDSSRIMMAVILGAMIGFDMGGPVNKAAWMATNVLLTEGIYTPCVYTNCAIVIPPLGYAIAAIIHKNKMSEGWRESAKGNWAMGFVGITEGAIPFTLTNPLKLIPINVIGSALGAGVAAALGTQAVISPLGGMYGFITMTNPWGYIIGYVVGALFIGFLAPIVADFSDDPEAAGEAEVDVDEIDISFE